MSLINLSCRLIITISVGVIIRKFVVRDESFDVALSAIVMNVLLPCMIVSAFCIEFSKRILLDGLSLIILCAVFTLLVLGITSLIYNKSGKRVFFRLMRYALTFTNFTYIGLPVLLAVYGSKGAFYHTMLCIPLRILLYSMLEPLLAEPGASRTKSSLRELLKKLFTPPIIAIFVGLLFFFSGWRLPTPAMEVMSTLSSICSPLGLLLCGMTLGRYKLRQLMDIRFLVIPVLRHFVVPAFALAFVFFLPVESYLKGVILIYSALPIPSATSMFALRYAPNDTEIQFLSSGSILLSTLISTVTIPIWVRVTQILF